MQDHGASLNGHAVVFIDALPNGHDWMFIEADGELVVAVQRDRWSPALMAEAWSDYASRGCPRFPPPSGVVPRVVRWGAAPLAC